MRYAIRWFKCKLKPPNNWGKETVKLPKRYRLVSTNGTILEVLLIRGWVIKLGNLLEIFRELAGNTVY